MGMFPDNQPPLSDYIDYDIGTEAYLSPIQKSGSLRPKVATFDVLQIDGDQDLLLHVDKNNCPRYGAAQDLSRKSEQYTKVEDYFVSNYKSSLEELTGTKISSPKEMVDICGYLQWAELANLTLKFTPKP